MEKTKEERTQELKQKIRQMEEEREVLLQHEKRIRKEEEDEDMELSRSHNVLSGIGRDCSSDNRKIVQLLEEKEYLLRTFRRKKMEYNEQFQQEIKKQRWKLERDRQQLQQERAHLKYNEKEER